MNRRGSLFVPLLVLVLAGAGCLSVPDRSGGPPDLAPPPAWTTPVTAPGAAPAPGTLPGWLPDEAVPGLRDAIETALARNHDLGAAAARLEAALARARIAGADLLPRVSAGARSNRQRMNFFGLPLPGAKGGVFPVTTTSWGLSLDVSWEADLWARVRAERLGARREAEAGAADLAGARLSLAAQVTKAWIARVAAARAEAIAREEQAVARATLDLVRGRYAGGLADATALHEAERGLAEARAGVERAARARDAATRQLEILLGEYPAGTRAADADLSLDLPPVPAGLPADLVARRPDLAALEARVAATDARLLAARRALYPRLSLTASGGTSTRALRDLLDRDYEVWNLVTNLVQPLFQGGRLRGNVRVAEARVKEMLHTWTSATLRAYGEVERALAAESTFRAERAHRVRALDEARAAEELARDRYARGLSDVTALLDARRRRFAAERALLALDNDRLANRVDLWLALGGDPPASISRREARR